MSKDKIRPLNVAIADLPVTNTGIVLDVVNELRGPNQNSAKPFFVKAVADFKLKVCTIATLTALSINCDALPSIPKGLKEIHYHIPGGIKEWDKEKYSNPEFLHLVEKQKTGTIGGYELHARLAGLPVANACCLDFFIANPDQIPESWKKLGAIFFWGTIYSVSDGNLYVRYLYWNGDKWISSYNWLENDWNDRNPALLANHFVSKTYI